MNVTSLVDESGTVIERYAYSPYGERTVLDADFSADADGVSDVDNALGHQGLHLDTESALYYNRNRYYSPALGRFTARDPLGYIDGMSTYEYVASTPVVAHDPSGKYVVVYTTPAFGVTNFDVEHCVVAIFGCNKDGVNEARTYELSATYSKELEKLGGGVSQRMKKLGLGTAGGSSGGTAGASSGGNSAAGSTAGSQAGSASAEAADEELDSATAGAMNKAREGQRKHAVGVEKQVYVGEDFKKFRMTTGVIRQSLVEDAKTMDFNYEYAAAAESTPTGQYDIYDNNCCHWARKVVEAAGGKWPFERDLNYGVNPGTGPAKRYELNRRWALRMAVGAIDAASE
jgi:RHS repeat-associated protein